MGSKQIQGKLWGERPDDWANIQEQTGMAGYTYALDFLKLSAADKLLDIGCGSGVFSNLAYLTGADVTGIDATQPLIKLANQRTPSAKFSTAEMEELPFDGNTFDVACGFNSFQYAENIENALKEAKRVLKNNGKLVVMIWGNKEDCEAATYLKAIGSLLPLPPPGAPGPFALTENQLLEEMLASTGFNIIKQEDIESVWDYVDVDTALKGLLSVGPAARAIEHNGFDKVYNTISSAIQPYTKTNGHVIYKNKFRVAIAQKTA